MPLDHYVSQVHLKRFNAPTLDNRQMYAFRKSDGHSFVCGSKTVCRTEEGNTTAYLSEPRLVEDFLKLIEPKYNAACAALLADDINSDAVFALAGFAAYITACSPTAIRITTAQLDATLKASAEVLDRAGQIPKAPPALGEKTLTELLSQGTVRFKINQKYPQAIGISSILDCTNTFGNFHWEILLNEHVDTPFFTSDFPVAVEATRDPRMVNRVVPLTPSLAVRICPRLELADRKLRSSFEYFSYTRRRLSRTEVVRLNRTIVRSAENLVFSSISPPWAHQFIMRNAKFRVENETANMRNGERILVVTRNVVREHSS